MISNRIGDLAEITRLSRKKSRLLSGIVVVAAILFGFVSDGQATWQKIYSQALADRFRACFFFNERVGFIGADLRDGVYKTTDGGQSWKVTMLPANNDGTAANGPITQILMIDSLRGWLTCEAPRNTQIPPQYPGLYQTVDGGSSWIPVNPLEQISDIYQTPAAIILTSRDVFQFGTGYVSSDGGANFFPGLFKTNGIDFVDDLNGVATGYRTQIWYHSTNGGLTWNGLSQADTVETWSVYGVKGSSWFFTAGEGDDQYPEPMSSVRRSSDYGATWIAPGYNLPYRTTGHIAGFGFTLYVQSYSSGSGKGIWRSNDSGRSWLNIGGPSNETDTRFAVLGCRGEVIYAFDDIGNVWKTVDGGDGSLPQFQFPPSALAVDSIDVCGPRDTLIAIKNFGCDTMYLTNANAPPEPLLAIIDTKTGKVPNLPLAIAPDSTGFLKLILEASLAGVYQTVVDLAIMHDGVFNYDTISVTSALKYYNPLHAIPSSIHYDSITLCESRDSLFTITDSCFTVQIVSAGLKYGVNFVLDSVYKNDSITPFSSKKFGVSFSPTQAGKDVDSLIVNFLVLGKAVRMSFPVVGTGNPDTPTLLIADRFGNPLPNVIDFDTITRCQDSIFAFTIFEQGCDSLFVSVQWLDSTKLNSPNKSQFLWDAPGPRWLTNNISDTAGIEALGTVLGSHKGYLRIADSAKGAKAATVQYIPYKVFVKKAPILLSLDDSPRNFDTIAFCDNNERTIVMQNLGCDTMHVSKAALSGANFVFVPAPTLPIVIGPNSSTSLTIEYLPVVSGAANGSLGIVTDADSAPNRTIPLLGYAIPTDTITFKSVATNLSVVPGDTASILIMPASNFHSNGLNAINMTLEYNGDVMSPYNLVKISSGIPGANVIANKGLPTGSKLEDLQIAIGGTNMQLDSGVPIVRVQYLIYLSDSLSTNFSISKLQLNDAKFNKCTLGSATDTGTIDLKFICGDSLIYNLLRYGTDFPSGEGIAPVSGVVYPDPVTASTFSIPYRALRAVSVGVEIMDWSGAVIYSGVQNTLEAGATAFEINGLALASGAYHYRLHPLDNGRVSVAGGFVVLK